MLVAVELEFTPGGRAPALIDHVNGDTPVPLVTVHVVVYAALASSGVPLFVHVNAGAEVVPCWVTGICCPRIVIFAPRDDVVVLAVKEKLTAPPEMVPIVSHDWSLEGA